MSLLRNGTPAGTIPLNRTRPAVVTIHSPAPPSYQRMAVCCVARPFAMASSTSAESVNVDNAATHAGSLACFSKSVGALVAT